MLGYDLVHINQRSLEKDIYRIFSFDKIVDFLSEERIALVLPRKWDDPFENFILKSHFLFQNIKSTIYEQCWTYNKETDFMWRVYAPNKDGVQVKTNLKLLCSNLIDNNIDLTDSLFAGKVKYDSWEKIKSQFENISISSNFFSNGDLIPVMKTLYIKRNEFVAENEVRIMYYSTENQGPNNKESVKFFKIEPNKIIEEILIDPRVSKDKFTVWEKLFRKKLGYNGIIKQSSLYKFRKVNLKE